MAKYLLIPLFVCIVIVGMFFIYLNINSPERIEYYNSEPSWLVRVDCIIKGGKIEKTKQEINLTDIENVNQNKLEATDNLKYDYQCHFH